MKALTLRNSFSLFVLVLGLAAMLAQTGCVGATAKTTSSNAGSTTTTTDAAPSIVAQPVGQSVTTGQTATFSVAAAGTAPLAYQWNKNGAPLGGAMGSSYTTPAAISGDNGAQFSVTVSNATGKITSSGATLTVTSVPVAPSISAAPVGQAVKAGQSATFVVTAAGTAPLTYQWNKNGAAIGGAVGSSYTMPAAATGDNGAQFSVTVSNMTGSVTSAPAALTVTAIATSPSITGQPVGQNITAGQTATFSVTASGTAPLTYQWNKNGATISGATASSYTTPATVTGDNGSQFSVTVSNTAGNATSNNATLAVTPATSAPSIAAQPLNISVTVGQTASFSVTASGTAPLAFQWRKNGAAISGATASSYTTPATVSGDNGSQFSVTVSNSTGNVASNNALLTITAAAVAPSISGQPTSQTVTAGQTASFSVAATGTAPLAYQWNKNGVVVAGATASSYTTPVTTTADSGTVFSVTVSNFVSSVTSGSASLTVNAPTYVISAAPTAFSFAATVNGSAPAQQTVVLISTPATTLAFTMSANQPWITMSATSGVTKSTLQLGVNTTGMTAGNYSGQIAVIPTGAGNPPMTIPVSLTITAAVPGTLTASVTTLNFNSVNLGSNSTLQATLTNSGSSSVDITNVSISGAGFSASGVPAGTILGAGQTATLNVTFGPSSAGTITGNVTVSSNASDSTESIPLTGIGVQAAQHSVSLAWAASTGSVAGYNVYRGTVSGGPYTKLNSALVSSESYTDTTVQPGQTYYYVVTSVNASGVESGYSNEVSAAIPIS